MDLTIDLIEPVLRWLGPLVAVGAGVGGAMWVTLRAIPERSSTRIFRQLVIVALALGSMVLIVLVLPIDSELRGQLLSLFGLVLTAVIALSSTTLVANAMAGLMLRTVGSFRPGDFISVERHFGRVTEQHLLHTEMQSEDRDLFTLPNLYLISHPIKVVSATGTLVSCDVSLGYDAPRRAVRDRLLEGAENAGLADPFVQIKALLDHAVAYRVSGFLQDVNNLVSMRTQLKAQVLDSLHGGGIEIVSPQFMNQRRLDVARQVAPAVDQRNEPEPDKPPPERLMFDKAELAAQLTRLQQQRDDVAAEIAKLEADKDAAADPEVAWRKRQLATLEEVIDTFHNEV